MRQHRWVSVLILLNILAVIVVIGVIIHNSMKTATIDIDVAPSGATVELNGHGYDNFDSYNILPGNYHVKISMEGMQTKEFDLSLQSDGFAKIETYLLDANGGFDYYLTHPDDEAALADIANDEASKAFVEEYNKIMSITDNLPILYDAYTDDFSEYTKYEIEIDRREDCTKALCLKITDTTGGNEQAAMSKLVEMGYDLNDYDITYEYVPDQFIRVEDEVVDEETE